MLLGREAELRVLNDLFLRAQGGISGATVVHGEPGSGKTTLLAHFASSLPPDATVLRSLGVESEAHLAYAGLTGLFRPILHLVPELPPMQRAALSSALALKRGVSGGDQLAVAAGGLALLAAAAAHSPTVVVVDDLQWLDPSSRFALLFTVRRISSDRIFFLLATRSDPEVDLVLKDIHRITLRGLDLNEAAQLVSNLQLEMSSATVERLVHATGGNPLALIEAARGLGDWDIAGLRSPGSPVTIGDRLESAFARQLDQLNGQGRLAVALVAAEPSGDRSLVSAAAMDIGAGPTGLREAMEADLIEESTTTIAVRHPLLGSVAIRRTSPRDRRRIHHALASYLVDEDQTERRAWHLAAATDSPDEYVASLLESAGNTALTRSDIPAAAAGFEQAAALSPHRADRGRRLFAAGLAASEVGQGDELLRQALACTDDPARRSDIVLLRVRSAIERGDQGLAGQLVRDERDAVQKQDRLSGVLLLALGGAAAWSEGDFPRLEHLAKEMDLLVKEEDDLSGPAVLPAAITLLASVVAGRPDMMAARMCASAVQSGIPAALATPVMHSLIVADHLAEADALRISARKQCRENGSLMALTWVDGVGIILALRRGELAQAHAAGTAALELLGTIASPFGQAEAQVAMAQIDALTGKEKSCRERIELVRHAAARSGNGVVVLQAEYTLGLLELGHGRYVAAARQLERTHQEFERKGLFAVGLWPVLADLIEVTALIGDEVRARGWLALLRERAKDDPLPFSALVSSRVEAVLAHEGELSKRFSAAMIHARNYGNIFEEGRTHLAYGRRLADLGRSEAVEELQLADQCFHLIGATPWGERAADALEAVGRSRPEHSPSLTNLLTPHEQEVVELAMTGATTREIATDLFMSPKTVESHLTSSYRKLGVRSKTQLAHVLNRVPARQHS